MRYSYLLILPLLAACQPGGAPTRQVPLNFQPDEGYRSVTLGSSKYHLAEAKSYPLIDSWTYHLPSETKDKWTRRIDTYRYKKVDAAEIYKQMQQATANQSQKVNAAARTVCFVTEKEDGKIKEPQVWRYADVAQGSKTNTYGTGVIWRFNTGTDYTNFMQKAFPVACTAMRSQQVIAPPPLSKP
ncbi:MAG: hypothetical protein EON60_08720 [Alphaproteobacteria bacterium]|nr:MAG: hypothetical protein EON60_08720 [Alphaproteobacteria bacterium]